MAVSRCSSTGEAESDCNLLKADIIEVSISFDGVGNRVVAWYMESSSQTSCFEGLNSAFFNDLTLGLDVVQPMLINPVTICAMYSKMFNRVRWVVCLISTHSPAIQTKSLVSLRSSSMICES